MRTTTTTTTMMMKVCALFLMLLNGTVQSFVAPALHSTRISPLYETEAPSDYDAADLPPTEKDVYVSYDDDDEAIRDALKRELLLLASVTNRGEYTSSEERDIVIDIVTQLEALNPTGDPAANCIGEWDLCLSSTQFFRSSPFFQSIRTASNNREMSENGFDLHERATSASRVGRVRQIIKSDQLVSEVELEVGLFPGFPIKVQGTVVTSASLVVKGPELWELRIQNTQVKGSNVPLLNQLLDGAQFEIPMGDVYSNLMGEVPLVPMKTYYVDEGIRITRDVDDNFFVFSRA